MIKNTLVIPVYKNAENISSLMAAVESLSSALGGELETVFVIDGSPDDSGEKILRAPRAFKSRTIFHSRNFGAFTAIRTGLEYARGEFVAVMAADLQEPPELVLTFFEILARDEADIVFGQRIARRDPAIRQLLSKIYWSIYRRLVINDIPKGGVDIFGCNRKVVDTILSISEANSSLIAQLFWAGFRRSFVPYERRTRVGGKSAWSLSRRFRYMMDSIFSYTDLPLLTVLWIGVAGCVVSLIVGGVTLVGYLFGSLKVPGYATLVLLISFFGSLNLIAQGMIGSYVWRALENTKRRPLRVISRVVEDDHGGP